MNLYKVYSVRSAVTISLVWMVALGSIIGIFGDHSYFFNFGPSNQTKFISFKIDNWSKWILIILYSFISQFIHSYINSTLYPFMTNVIRDYKSEWRESYFKAQLITFVYKLYYWFHDICNVFLVLTLQIQFYLPALIADILVGIITTRNFINNKIKHQKYCDYAII